MKVYVAYCKDRHEDPVVKVFRYRSMAEDYVRQFMKRIGMSDGDLSDVIEELEGECYLLYIRYGEEGDHSFVVEADLQSGILL